MKFFKLILNLRKYLFTNITAVWFYCFLIFIIEVAKFFMVKDNPMLYDVLMGALILTYLLFLLLGSLLLLAIVEILLRKFVIEKYFPNLKLNIKFKIPKFIIYIYNFIFSVSFILSNVLFILAIIFVIYRNIYG